MSDADPAGNPEGEPVPIPAEGFHWGCPHTWGRSAYNTAWCLIGCAIGDFGTIFYFQYYEIKAPVLAIMALAMFNGIVTSIALETVLLLRSMGFPEALRTATGMSLISMLMMELAMNLTDLGLVGELRLYWWTLLPALAAGFVAAWPYNYWRLKKFGIACH